MKRSRTIKIQQGFTLIELMISVAVFAISISVVTPTFNNLIAKHRFKGALETVYYAFLMARSEAVKSNRAIVAAFQPGNNWGVRLSDSETCAVNSICNTSDWIQVTQGNEFIDTSLTAVSFLSNKTAFDPIRGTAATGDLTLALDGYQAKVELSLLGYPRVCAANSFTMQHTGYPAC